MRISALSSALPMFKLETWPNEIELFVVLLNELVLLKESMLLEELLLSPRRDCDISLFCCSLGVVDSVYCVEDSENWFLSTGQ